MITLHHIPQSRSMRILWLLEELEVEGYTLVPRVLDRSLHSEEFMTLSPAGRIPALEIDGERMFESGAIMEYLCERFPEVPMGRPPGSPDRMAWLVWMHFAETVSHHAATLAVQHIFLRPEARSTGLMKFERARLHGVYDAIEARLSTPLENRDYLLTSGFSAADVAVGQAIYMARHFLSIDAHPELSKWYARITARPAFQAALPQPGQPGLYSQEFYEVPA